MVVLHRAAVIFNWTDSGGKTAGSTWVVEPSWEEFRRIENLYSNPVPRSNPPSGWVFTDMQVSEIGSGNPRCSYFTVVVITQVAAHAFGDPREEKRGEATLPWTYDASVAVLPGYREFIPEFRRMKEKDWNNYVTRRAPAFMAPQIAALKGALPPEGLWPEALAKAEVRGVCVQPWEDALCM